MQYRKFGKLDWKVSILGFGAMRLPVIGGDSGNIDDSLAIPMLRRGIDGGINYVDTAYGYHNGKSENFVGRALKDGYREKVKVATKLPCWLINSKEDMDEKLNEQLTRLDMDYIDFYLLHALNKPSWAKMKELGVIEWADQKVKEGKIRHLGFSFHDDTEAFKQIIDDYDGWVFCQIQYSYMDEKAQAGMEGLQYAGKKGVAVVVMEPLRGGKLANPSPKMTDLWNSFPVKKTPAEWALDYIWHQPEVSVILSGMSTMEQVEENLREADHAQVNMLKPEELDLIYKVREMYHSQIRVNCTSCKYCMPCPEKVDISGLFGLYNEAAMFDSWAEKKQQYQWWFKDKQTSADLCIQCGVCEEKCPQNISIPEQLKEVKDQLGTT